MIRLPNEDMQERELAVLFQKYRLSVYIRTEYTDFFYWQQSDREISLIDIFHLRQKRHY